MKVPVAALRLEGGPDGAADEDPTGGFITVLGTDHKRVNLEAAGAMEADASDQNIAFMQQFTPYSAAAHIAADTALMQQLTP